VRKVAGASEADAARAVVGSGTTLLWLVGHLADAETTWVVRRFAGEPGTPAASSTVAEAVSAYRATWARVDAIVAAASLDDECADIGDAPQVNLRWVLAHLLEETARHAGHADILRELIDGETGR
jgi:hypothetical protein